MPSAEVLIGRQEGVGCVDALAELYRHLHEHQTGVAPTVARLQSRSAEHSWICRRRRYEQWMSEAGSFVLLATLEEQPVGYALVTLTGGYCAWDSGPTIGEVRDLVVAPAVRDMGVGGRLMDRVQADLHRDGVREFRLSVIADNADAIRLYEARGMVLTSKTFLAPTRPPAP
jgi:ribosomal protein S18 acetylase RimI-like enzyme